MASVEQPIKANQKQALYENERRGKTDVRMKARQCEQRRNFNKKRCRGRVPTCYAAVCPVAKRLGH